MNEHSQVSVIIPCYNEAGYIRPFLDSLLAQDYPREHIEFLLIDGGSCDGTLQILEEFAAVRPRFKVLENPHKYVPHGLNLGLSAASGSIVVRMDVHAQYPPDYISSLVFWIESSGADNVGGVWRTKPGGDDAGSRGIAAALCSFYGVGNSLFRIGVSAPTEVDTVPFGCYRREIFSRIGLFDEDLLRNQDDEFNSRIIRAGGRILLVPEIRISYYARKRLRDLARMMYQYGYYKPLANKKAGRSATWRQFAPPGLVSSLLGLSFLSLLFPGAGYFLAGLVFVYLLFVSVGAACSAARDIPSLPWTALAIITMHFAYGIGYLKGLFNGFSGFCSAPGRLASSRE